MNNLNFGEAVAAMKEGKCVSRSGWNGKGMYVYLNRGAIDYRSLVDVAGEDIPAEGLGVIDGVHLSLFDKGDEGIVTRLPNINMKSASGATVTGWLASQTDVLAEDWGLSNTE